MVIDKLRDIPFSPPDITDEEIAEVVHTLKSGWITTGPKTKEFEKKIASYIGTSRVACLNSATAAMEMTLRILGIGPGDEVITTAYTYTATASVIHHVGAKIVLVDVAPDSYEMDYLEMGKAITERTKAIIAVDIAGKMCDYDAIYEVIESKRALFKAKNDTQQSFNRPVLVADSAHAFGASSKGRNSGEAADFTCFSFHAVKNLTTAEGGAVTWRNDLSLDNEWLYNQYMLFSLHGQSKDALAKTQKGSWEYDVVMPAYKCNMTDITASIGLVQLNRYDSLKKKRREIIDIYDKEMANINIVTLLKHFGNDYTSSGHLYLVRVSGISENVRNDIIKKMANYGISCNVHYKPLPLLTAYKNMGFKINEYPNSYNQFENAISLPLNSNMSREDAMYVMKVFADILKSLNSGLNKES